MSRRKTAPVPDAAARTAQSLPSLMSLSIFNQGQNADFSNLIYDPDAKTTTHPTRKEERNSVQDSPSTELVTTGAEDKMHEKLAKLALIFATIRYGVTADDLKEAMPVLVMLGLYAGMQRSVSDVVDSKLEEEITGESIFNFANEEFEMNTDESSGRIVSELSIAFPKNKRIDDLYPELVGVDPKIQNAVYAILQAIPLEFNPWADQYVGIEKHALDGAMMPPQPMLASAKPLTPSTDPKLPTVVGIGVPPGCARLDPVVLQPPSPGDKLRQIWHVPFLFLFRYFVWMPTIFLTTIQLFWDAERTNAEKVKNRAIQIQEQVKELQFTVDGDARQNHQAIYALACMLFCNPAGVSQTHMNYVQTNDDSVTTNVGRRLSMYAAKLVDAIKNGALKNDLQRGSIGHLALGNLDNLKDETGAPVRANSKEAHMAELGHLMAYAIDPYARIAQRVRKRGEGAVEYYDIAKSAQMDLSLLVEEMKDGPSAARVLERWRHRIIRRCPVSHLVCALDSPTSTDAYPFGALDDYDHVTNCIEQTFPSWLAYVLTHRMPEDVNQRKQYIPGWIFTLQTALSSDSTYIKNGFYDEQIAEAMMPDGYINRATRIQLGCLCAMLMRLSNTFNDQRQLQIARAQADSNANQPLARIVLSSILHLQTGEKFGANSVAVEMYVRDGNKTQDELKQFRDDIVSGLKVLSTNPDYVWLRDRLILSTLIIFFLGESHQRVYYADSIWATWAMLSSSRCCVSSGIMPNLPMRLSDVQQATCLIRRSTASLLSTCFMTVVALINYFARIDAAAIAESPMDVGQDLPEVAKSKERYDYLRGLIGNGVGWHCSVATPLGFWDYQGDFPCAGKLFKELTEEAAQNVKEKNAVLNMWWMQKAGVYAFADTLWPLPHFAGAEFSDLAMCFSTADLRQIDAALGVSMDRLRGRLSEVTEVADCVAALEYNIAKANGKEAWDEQGALALAMQHYNFATTTIGTLGLYVVIKICLCAFNPMGLAVQWLIRGGPPRTNSQRALGKLAQSAMREHRARRARRYRSPVRQRGQPARAAAPDAAQASAVHIPPTAPRHVSPTHHTAIGPVAKSDPEMRAQFIQSIIKIATACASCVPAADEDMKEFINFLNAHAGLPPENAKL